MGADRNRSWPKIVAVVVLVVFVVLAVVGRLTGNNDVPPEAQPSSTTRAARSDCMQSIPIRLPGSSM